MTIRNISALLFFQFLALTAVAQISVNKLDLAKAPKGMKYEGKVKTAVHWKDVSGEHIVLTTETGIHQSKKFKHETEGSDAELFAYHFLVKNDSAFQTWRVYDFIADCPVDIEASFINDTFQVTDLDGNGVSEIWLMYKTSCHGDVSPCDMKIIMYQGTQKYAMRGQNKVSLGTNEQGHEEFLGGEYTFDKAFTEGSKQFSDFAKKMWEKNIMQTWGE